MIEPLMQDMSIMVLSLVKILIMNEKTDYDERLDNYFFTNEKNNALAKIML